MRHPTNPRENRPHTHRTVSADRAARRARGTAIAPEARVSCEMVLELFERFVRSNNRSPRPGFYTVRLTRDMLEAIDCLERFDRFRVVSRTSALGGLATGYFLEVDANESAREHERPN